MTQLGLFVILCPLWICQTQTFNMNSQGISLLCRNRRPISPNLSVRRTCSMLLRLHNFGNRPFFMDMSQRRIRRNKLFTLRQMSNDIIPSLNRILFRIVSIKPIRLREVNTIRVCREGLPICLVPTMPCFKSIPLTQTNAFIPISAKSMRSYLNVSYAFKASLTFFCPAKRSEVAIVAESSMA